MVTDLPRLTAGGVELDVRPESFGFLRDSSDARHDVAELQRRQQEDGYLYLPGFFPRPEVAAARVSITNALADQGLLHPDHPTIDAIAKPGHDSYFRPDVANANAELKSLIYGPQIMAFYDELFGEPARHYDFTWLRTVAPGTGTSPHMDAVYMGRGTKDVMTAWVPLGDVPLSIGGLIVLEKSHQNRPLVETYGQMDVDTACVNQGDVRELDAKGYPGFGELTTDPVALRARLGGRWLTAREFRMGDLLTFSIFLVHGSLDNGSNVIRISSDSRYQRASEPADERWIGENPPGHGGAMVRGLIC